MTKARKTTKKTTTANRSDVYEQVTNKIVEALEAGAKGSDWRAPWHSTSGGAGFELARNVVSHKEYRGVNAWVLLSEQFLKGYSQSLWGTYKQWAVQAKDEAGELLWHDAAQTRPVLVRHVRKGEKGTTVILWKPTKRTGKNDKGEDEVKNSLFATSFTVFNVDQVEGYEAPAAVYGPPEPQKQFDVIEHAADFFEGVGATIRHGGSKASYFPAGDWINLPEPTDFVSNVDYYSTSAHEHIHWTGHKSRCNREFGERFGNEKYAFEELVAELGAAYTCGILSLSNEPREDHAQYLASWIKVLKADPKAIVTAASAAQRAVDFLVDTAGESTADAGDADAEVDGELAAAI